MALTSTKLLKITKVMNIPILFDTIIQERGREGGRKRGRKRGREGGKELGSGLMTTNGPRPDDSDLGGAQLYLCFGGEFNRHSEILKLKIKI